MIRIFAAAACAATVVACVPAQAQSWPSRNIRIVVSVPAGAITDVITRRIAAVAAPMTGQTWIIENRAGANFLPGAEACRQAKPDGYTFCSFTTSVITFNPVLLENISYVPERDFKPVIMLAQFIAGVVVTPKLDVKSFDELRALAIARRGQLNFGTYGPASSPNVFRHFLEELWKTEITGVGYKGSNEMLAALTSGEVHMTWSALGSWADNPGDAKGRIVTQDATKRSPKLPGVPVHAEAQGLKDFPISTWIGMFAPSGTPDEIVNQMNRIVGEAINKPEITDYLTNQLMETRVTSAPDFAVYVARESAETARVLRHYNVPKIR